jgi:hypothetical protein
MTHPSPIAPASSAHTPSVARAAQPHRDTPVAARTTWRRRALTALAIVGPSAVFVLDGCLARLYLDAPCLSMWGC